MIENSYYLSLNSKQDVFATIKLIAPNLQLIDSIEDVNTIEIDYEQDPLLIFVDIRNNYGCVSALIDQECYAYYVIIDSNYENVENCLRMARDVNIRDYITTPFTSSEIQDCIDRYYSCMALRKVAEGNNLIIKEKGLLISIETRSIKLLEGDGSYTRIHTADKIYIVSKTIKKILELLPNQFIRAHRSFAVHKKQLRSLIGNTLLLHNGEQVKVSRSGRQVILDHFNKAS
jgi:DNA-binding LytR/AlgR family response regulator